jgi:hypothetical protein
MPKAQAVFDRTSAFVRLIDEHIPQVHTASRQFTHLNQYWSDCTDLLGRLPEVDIVHWNGHGSTTSVTGYTEEGDPVSLSAAQLIERTQGAFLYVVHACDSGGSGMVPDGDGADLDGGDALEKHDTFSSALLKDGASAVLGMHGVVDAAQFEHLPILYALLVQGLPLDYCVQYMRGFFWGENARRQKSPYEPWYKLLLRTSCASYLDGTSSALPASSNEHLVLKALVPAYARALAAKRCADGGRAQLPDDPTSPLGAGATQRAAIDALLQRFYDTALMK